MITGARLKDEITANNKVVSMNKNLETRFTGGELEAGAMDDYIVMPAIANNQNLSEQERKLYRGIADHETFHFRHTPLQYWKEIGKYLEAAGDPQMMSLKMLNAVEDVRIERLGMQSHIGTRRNIQCVLNKMIEAQADSLSGGVSAIGSTSVWITWQGRKKNGMRVELPNTLQAISDKLHGVLGNIDHLYESDLFDVQARRLAVFLVEQFNNSRLQDFLDGVPPEESKQKNSLGKGQNEEVVKGKNELVDNIIRNGMTSCDMNEVLRLENPQACPYIVEPDTVDLIQVKPANYAINIRPSIDSLGRQFATALKSVTQSRMDNTRIEGNLDSRKLVEAFTGQESVWIKRRSHERGYNTAVSFVVDHSGSMDTAIDFVMEMVASLAKAVRAVNVPFEVTGFNEQGPFSMENKQCLRTGHLNIIKYKGFDESLNLKKLANSDMHTAGYTPDTEALELAVGRIAERIEKRKIIVVLTDGASRTQNNFVQIQDKNIRGEVVFDNHRKSVMEQAREIGVEVFYILVGRHSIRHVPTNHILHVYDFDSLESKLFQLFFNAIARGAK